MLRLAGVYRPPLGMAGAVLDRVMLHRVATATDRSFLGALARPAAEASPEGGRLPLAWLPHPDPEPG